MPYNKVHPHWENLPAQSTPVDADALDQMEQGISDATDTAEAAASAASSAAGGLAAHLIDPSDAHAAEAISVTDAGARFTGDDVESVLAELHDEIETSAYQPGGTDVAIADGGTGASTAANARANLGLAIGTDIPALSGLAETLAADSAFTADRALTGGLSLTNATSDDVGPEMTLHGYNGGWLFGIDVANAPTSRDPVPVAIKNAYYLNDGATTNGSPTLTSASEGGFSSLIVGATLSGAGIPGGTTVSSVASATSLTMSANATATGTSVRVYVNKSGVTDLIYLKHRGALPTTIGLGVTPPDSSARVQIGAGHANHLGLDGLKILGVASFTGKFLKLTDSADVDRVWFDSSFSLTGSNSGGNDAALTIKGDATNQRPLLFAKADGSAVYGFQYDSNNLKMRYFTGGVDSFRVETDGTFRTLGTAVLQGDATNQRPVSLTKSDGSVVYGFQYSSNSMRFRYITGGVDSFEVQTDGNVKMMQRLQLSGGGSGGYGGGGLNCLAIENTNTVPSTNPSSGGVIYAEAGALKYRGSSGTVTTLGVA